MASRAISGQKAANWFYSPITALVLITYFIVAHFWTIDHVRYLPAVANPELALVSSFFTPLDPLVTDAVPKEYFNEFINVRRADNLAESGLTIEAPYSLIHSPAQWHPRNVLMVIMESVGNRRLQIYNAPYFDTPEMERLTQHAMIFDRMYVAQAYTSGAMSAIFCSLSP